MKSLKGTLPIKHDQCPSKRLGHRHTQKTDHVKSQGEGAIYKPKRKPSKQTNPLTPWPGTSSPHNCEKVKQLHLWRFVMAALGNSHREFFLALPGGAQPVFFFPAFIFHHLGLHLFSVLPSRSNQILKVSKLNAFYIGICLKVLWCFAGHWSFKRRGRGHRFQGAPNVHDNIYMCKRLGHPQVATQWDPGSTEENLGGARKLGFGGSKEIQGCSAEYFRRKKSLCKIQRHRSTDVFMEE